MSESGDGGGRVRFQVVSAIRLALVALPIIAYAGLVHAGFLNYDDTGYVSANHRVLQGLSFDNVGWAFTTQAMGNYHPLTWLSYMVDCQLFGESARAHHLVNLALHVVDGVLLFELLARTTRAPYRAAMVAALFALHPTHVESVAWISERKDVLSTLFFLLTALLYVGWVKDRRPVRYVALLIVYALGLLTKPMLVTLPFVLLLLDVWPLARIDGWRRRCIEKVPLLALALGSSVATYAAQSAGGAMSTLEALPIPMRLANALVSYARYLGKTVWPMDLAVFYPLREGWSGLAVAGSLALLVAITAVAMASYRRRPYLLVGWLLYLGLLVPVIGLVQVGMQAMADRYLYLPSIGLFIMIVWGVADLAASRAPRREVSLAVVSAGILAALLLTTRAQVRHWTSTFTLFQHALAVTEGNWEAENHLGLAYVTQGDLAAAIDHYRRALAMRPSSAAVHGNLGIVLAQAGRMPEAVAHFERSLALNGRQAEAHYNLGNALLKVGQVDRAVQECEAATRLAPLSPAAHYNLGTALAASGAPERALEELRRATALDPFDANAENNLGVVLANQGDLAGALTHFRAAVRIDPGLTSALANAEAAEAGLRGR